MEKSQTENTLSSNKLPKWLIAILLIIPIVLACFQTRILDNDFYFLYPTGEYIVKNGFPHTDILSMHASMKIVVQQWLSSVLFYFAYSQFGKYGVIALIYLCYSIINYLLFRLSLLISRNELLSILLTWLSGFYLFFYFIVSRPHVFTYIVILAEVLILEKYVQTNKKAYLLGLPVLSCLLINLHAAMWPMLFVFMAPYIVSAALILFKRLKKHACGSLWLLLFSMSVCVATGFLNPYGIKNVLYMFSTSGQNHINSIGEMSPTSTGTTYGFIFFFLLLAMSFITFVRKNHPFVLRFFLLFTGTLFMALMHYKAIPYFLFFGIASFGYMLKDIKITIQPQNKISKYFIAAFLLVSFAFSCKQIYEFSQIMNKSELTHYERLDEVIQILDHSQEEVILYTDFDDAQYLEFYGYPAFVDGRAELFLKKNNGEYDYFEEYYDFVMGLTYYRDFLDKYDFNYLIINFEKQPDIYTLIVHDNDFEVIYESEGVYLFKRINE